MKIVDARIHHAEVAEIRSISEIQRQASGIEGYAIFEIETREGLQDPGT